MNNIYLKKLMQYKMHKDYDILAENTKKLISKLPKTLKYHYYSDSMFNLLYQNIIYQMPVESTQFPKKLIDTFYNVNLYQTFTFTQILSLCNEKYVFYNDILTGLSNNSNKTLTIFKLNFNDKKEILKVFQTITNDTSNLSEIVDVFYQQNKNTNAGTLQISDTQCLLFININTNIASIYHEFIHILQNFFDILFLNDIKYNVPTVDARLNISQTSINEIFKKDQLIPNTIITCLNIEDLSNNNYSSALINTNKFLHIIEQQNINVFKQLIELFISKKFNFNGLIILYLSYQQEKQLYNYLKQFILSYLEKLEFID